MRLVGHPARMKMLIVPGSAGVSPNVVYFFAKRAFRSEGPFVNRPGREAGIGLNQQ
jgi:hypothetical protein